jgi:hypothetical protein
LWDLVKKYWDLFIGFIVGLALSIMSRSDNEIVRWVYSDILIVLASVGLFRFIRQAIDQERKKKQRERTMIDGVVDSLAVIKVINFAQEPTKEGNKIKKLFITLWGGKNYIMKKLKELFDKYKGYLLTVVLGVLTAVEQYGGFINQLFGGVLVFNGVAVLPVITLALTIVVGLLSNGYSKEQVEKIKALSSKSTTNELVAAEIKKQLKDNTTKHTQFVKIVSTKESELADLNSELEGHKNRYFAKKEMYGMTPQLATAEDVNIAANAVKECESKISNKEAELADARINVSNLEATINALKSKL